MVAIGALKRQWTAVFLNRDQRMIQQHAAYRPRVEPAAALIVDTPTAWCDPDPFRDVIGADSLRKQRCQRQHLSQMREHVVFVVKLYVAAEPGIDTLCQCTAMQ